MLAVAAIDQKAAEIAPVPLKNAINLNLNKRYIYLLLIPIALYLLTSAISPGTLRAGREHLINYNRQYAPPAPFSLQLSEIPTSLVAGQSFKVEVNVAQGRALPEELLCSFVEMAKAALLTIAWTRFPKPPTAIRSTM